MGVKRAFYIFMLFSVHVNANLEELVSKFDQAIENNESPKIKYKYELFEEILRNNFDQGVLDLSSDIYKSVPELAWLIKADLITIRNEVQSNMSEECLDVLDAIDYQIDECLLMQTMNLKAYKYFYIHLTIFLDVCQESRESFRHIYKRVEPQEHSFSLTTDMRVMAILGKKGRRIVFNTPFGEYYELLDIRFLKMACVPEFYLVKKSGVAPIRRFIRAARFHVPYNIVGVAISKPENNAHDGYFNHSRLLFFHHDFLHTELMAVSNTKYPQWADVFNDLWEFVPKSKLLKYFTFLISHEFALLGFLKDSFEDTSIETLALENFYSFIKNTSFFRMIRRYLPKDLLKSYILHNRFNHYPAIAQLDSNGHISTVQGYECKYNFQKNIFSIYIRSNSNKMWRKYKEKLNINIYRFVGYIDVARTLINFGPRYIDENPVIENQESFSDLKRAYELVSIGYLRFLNDVIALYQYSQHIDTQRKEKFFRLSNLLMYVHHSLNLAPFLEIIESHLNEDFSRAAYRTLKIHSEFLRHKHGLDDAIECFKDVLTCLNKTI